MTVVQSSKSGNMKLVMGAVAIIVAVALTGAYFVWKQKVHRAQRDECAHSLWHLGVTLTLLDDAAGSDPKLWVDDIRDPSGKPLLSWRVKVLPYLEEETLYRQFNLSETWDSEHNKALVSKMPKVFRGMNRDDEQQSSTTFQRITGSKTLFPQAMQAVFDGKKIPDGPESTILLIEGAKAIPWTQPGDLSFDGEKTPAISHAHQDGVLAVFVDGTVRTIPPATDDKTLRALITPKGGEKVSLDSFPVNEAALGFKQGMERFMKSLGQPK